MTFDISEIKLLDAVAQMQERDGIIAYQIGQINTLTSEKGDIQAELNRVQAEYDQYKIDHP